MKNYCPICANIDIQVKGKYRAVDSTFNGLHLAHCYSCGMVFAAPMPSEADLEEYNANYFTRAHGGRSSIIAKAFFSGIARLRYAHLTSYLKKRSINVTRILEYGPGQGFFSRNWLERNPQTKYTAIETDNSCHASLREMGVQLIDSTTIGRGNESESVDLVVMSHVLEHISNPIKFLTEATRNLRKFGVLFIEVPCGDWEHKPIDEPHLLFFDKKSMLHLMKTLGFEHIQLSYHGQEISKLRSISFLESKLKAVRSKLISFGLIWPFAKNRTGMELIENPLERAVLAPYKAHCESSTPAWWLRVVAIKS